MKIAFLLSLLSLNAYGLSCDNIPEGKVVRIDQGAGSLANAALQDQDGIGSCFGNQTSLVLQSYLPGNPNLSYLNISLYYSADEKKKNYVKNLDNRTPADNRTLYTKSVKSEDGSVNPEGSSGIWGGNMCETFNLMKDKQKSTRTGALCKTEDIALEHSFFDSKETAYNDTGFVQEKSMLQVSKYMNTYQQIFGSPANLASGSSPELLEKRRKADEFSNALKNFIASSGNSYFNKICKTYSPETSKNALSNAIVRLLDANPRCIGPRGLSDNDSTVCKMIAQFGTFSISSGRDSAIKYKIAPKLSEKLDITLPMSYDKKTGFSEYMKDMVSILKTQDKIPTNANNQGVKDLFFKNLLKSFDPQDIKAMESDYKKMALNDIDDCKKNNMLAYFKDKSQFLAMAKKDRVLCNYTDLLTRASDLAGILPEKTLSNMTGFMDFLTSKAGLNYDEGVMSLIAQDCTPDKRIAIPEKMTCDSIQLQFSPDDFNSNYGVTGRKIKEYRQKMIDAIHSNRATGIDICTRFLKEPNYNFHKDNPATKTNDCANSGKHGFHAITMIGYRCKNNKVEYLAQNSWGPNWKQEPYEIEKGKIWLDEDKLMMNMDRINWLKP